jgi:hypothetical protein
MSVAMTFDGNEIRHALPRPLFREPRLTLGNDEIRQVYAPLGRGDRFIALLGAPEAQPKGINVVLNWSEALKRMESMK